MEQELERIFRLMALLFPATGLHDAYVGVRSSNPTVRANALEFLDSTLKPELRQVLVPLLDSYVTTEERVTLANRFVGAPLETPEQAVETMLASEDVWLRSCGIYAIGALRLHKLEPALDQFERCDRRGVEGGGTLGARTVGRRGRAGRDAGARSHRHGRRRRCRVELSGRSLRVGCRSERTFVVAGAHQALDAHRQRR